MNAVKIPRNAVSKYSISYLEDAEKVLPRLYPSSSYEVFGAEDISNRKPSIEEERLLIEPRLLLDILPKSCKVESVQEQSEYRMDPAAAFPELI